MLGGSNEVQTTLDRAIHAHRSGLLDEAEKLYRAVLSRKKNQFESLHFLGVIEFQRGRHEEARRLIEKSLQIDRGSADALGNYARVLNGMERYHDALKICDEALKLKPGFVEALVHRGNALRGLRQFEKALADFDQALKIKPDYLVALNNRGNVLNDLGRYAEALACYDHLLKVKPDHAEAAYNRGNVLLRFERREEAVASFDKAIAINPGYAEAYSNRGSLLLDLMRVDEALASFDRAIGLKPEYAEAHYNRGNALRDLKRPSDALASYDQAIALKPDYAEAWCNRGIALFELKRAADALASYDKAIASKVDYAEVYVNRCNALLDLERITEALASCEQAIAIKPDYAEPYCLRGNALMKLRRAREALESYNKAISKKPDYAEAYYNRGLALMELKRAQDALESYERAILLKQDYADAYCNRGNALLELGRVADAVTSYNTALTLTPDFALAGSNRIFAYDFVAEAGFARHQELRRDWYRAYAKDLPLCMHANSPEPSRRLVIGYASPDFRRHSAAYSFGPLLRNHDHAGFKVVCYSDVRVEDEFTREFRRAADKWHQVFGLPDAAVIEQIRADRIDILVDLAGHSAGNRLLVFARKPAPVQVTAWGHATGTGLPTIDYLFSDPVAVPQPVRPLFAEAVHDLPCLITYEAPSYAPDISEIPAKACRCVTFGCLNRFSKISADLLGLWARILHAVPGSRLLLKDPVFDTSSQQALVLETLAGLGLDADRIKLLGGSSHNEHLAAFRDVDIALDPFPQNGGTSTWEALWMGVPVIAKLGNSVPSRISAAILTSIGLAEWVAEDEDHYAELAVKKAGELTTLAGLRPQIRSIISASPAGNPVLYTRAVEDAYRAVWHHWCESKSTPSVAPRRLPYYAS